MDGPGQIEIERQRHPKRETDRQTDREREKEGETDRQTDREVWGGGVVEGWMDLAR